MTTPSSCRSCGAAAAAEDRYCGTCGQPREPGVATPPTRPADRAAGNSLATSPRDGAGSLVASKTTNNPYAAPAPIPDTRATPPPPAGPPAPPPPGSGAPSRSAHPARASVADPDGDQLAVVADSALAAVNTVGTDHFYKLTNTAVGLVGRNIAAHLSATDRPGVFSPTSIEVDGKEYFGAILALADHAIIGWLVGVLLRRLKVAGLPVRNLVE